MLHGFHDNSVLYTTDPYRDVKRKNRKTACTVVNEYKPSTVRKRTGKF